MTTFIYTLTGEEVTTKNNTNNVHEGQHITISCDDGQHIMGIVSSVSHVIRKWENVNGLERSTHDIVIKIDPE